MDKFFEGYEKIIINMVGLGNNLEKYRKPLIEFGLAIYELYQGRLAMILDEQEEVENELINKGYAYFTNYHLITLYSVVNETASNDFSDEVFEAGIMELVQSEYENIESSVYVREVFESTDKNNLTHIIPLLTLLVERLMRILTDKLNSGDKQRQIKDMIRNSIIEYRTEGIEELQKLEYDDLENTNRLKEKIEANIKELYIKTYKSISDEDFLEFDEKAKGTIINRHALLHGKINLDELTKEHAIKLLFLIHFYIDLIKLRNSGKLLIKD